MRNSNCYLNYARRKVTNFLIRCGDNNKAINLLFIAIAKLLHLFVHDYYSLSSHVTPRRGERVAQMKLTPDPACSRFPSSLPGADPGFGFRGGEIRRWVWGPPRSLFRSQGGALVGETGGETPRKLLRFSDYRAPKSGIFMSKLPSPIATVAAM